MPPRTRNTLGGARGELAVFRRVEAGGAAAAHGSMQHALARPQEGEYPGDLRPQRDRRIGEVVSMLGQRRSEASASVQGRRVRAGENAPCRLAKTSGVGNGMPGLTRRIAHGGKGGAGASRSPTPETSAARPARHIGTSAPSRAARSNSSSAGSATRHKSINKRNAAAHRPNRRRGPPPREYACRGAARHAAQRLPDWPNRRAALRTRLSASSTSVAANGPSTVSERRSDGDASISSARSVKATRELSRW